MRKLTLFFILLSSQSNFYAQTSCSDLLNRVESESYGTTYSSYGSDAISQVTFYDLTDDSYNTYYFAVVQFTSSYNKYIYQVSSITERNYSYNYITSAGKAFWKYIQPYNENLNCAPDF
ncbi:hypothetical protein [Pseudozobellia sp. WGM2]|uniref:hypothetical protein n=1 Tax=Pseudozobellia sp. WGM2 TaxID=2787625 RepID=UPI001ADFB643|nr:hypothetical protein [Pseudozobellia sp. WGM2]